MKVPCKEPATDTAQSQNDYPEGRLLFTACTPVLHAMGPSAPVTCGSSVSPKHPRELLGPRKAERAWVVGAEEGMYYPACSRRGGRGGDMKP